ncbi:hypothetical protein H4R18_000698 [Coemansia javaensis]|uniref:chitin synthase n=1 Tax=Coemansia javaensis TaxID=2761396 RepID=A0A9W8HH80_9FUNG|nr:hypothetical protein H4R18_000698 [Coemansia javaensis]
MAKDDNPFADQASALHSGGAHMTYVAQMAGAQQRHAAADSEKDANMDRYAQKARAAGAGGGTGGEGNVDKGGHEHVEDLETTSSRRMWVALTWVLTCCIPSPLLNWCGRMRRPDVRMAWREKVAICILIVFMWAVLLFAIIGLGLILCPKEYVWTMDDVSGHNTPESSYVALRGTVYDVTDFMRQQHGTSAWKSTQDAILQSYSGNDINASFPIPVRVACPQFVTAKDDPNYLFFYPVQGASDIDPNAQNMFQHTMNRDPTSKKLQDPNFFAKYALPTMKKFKKGGVVWSFDWINSMYKDQSKYWRVINKEVFNMQPYFDAAKGPLNTNNKYNLLDSRVESIMDQNGFGSADITTTWDAIAWDPATRDANYNCMKNLFYVGKVDDRHSVRCLFTNYMLLAFACLLMLVVLVKFLTALQFGNKRRPVPPSKYVVCQVPCYTEGDESLLKTIDSLTALDYPDNHKLIFIICDGNIIGSGNDRPTPRLVLDILGVDPEYDPPGRDYLAIAEGSRRHNIGKIYSGLYEHEGHTVPFMVAVKVGTPDEANRSGNRGKRDSQIMLMAFFNKVHFDLPMTPLELEMYHQMRHIIGMDPAAFEYILQVDADTEVLPDSLPRLIAACSSDQRIAGICGETMLGNEGKSWTTMMQVYEYFISHHMAKAFESLFGAVTCLPGCFCMYRLRSAEGKPLLVAKPVLEAYSELHVDTLHKKNLLSLGEDRYLTTLMMKHFPQYKLKFVQDAKCRTIAPEKWAVLVSQRRRWINSTIHNLAELMFLPDMCGFCCFSMRFVVFLDLFGTITMPCTLFYFAYLVYVAVTKIADVGYISLILIGAIYGVQAIIFILRREWQHIGWMLIYLLAYPLWSFILPIYSFWHMDDFSWGNTRVVVGDGKRKLIIQDDKPFDPASIPQRRWREYEADLNAAGVLNAPPPNMNPNADSSREDDRGTMISRFSGVMGSPSRFGATTPVAGIPRAATPTTVISGIGSVDPRLNLSTPVAQAQQYQQYQTASGFAGARPMSTVAGPIAQPIDNTMPPRAVSYYQYTAESTGYFDNPVPLAQHAPAAASPHGAYSPGSNYLGSPVMQAPALPGAMAGGAQAGAMYPPPQQQTYPQQAYPQQRGSIIGTGAPPAPTDDQLVESIRAILGSNDLNNVTKKSVRAQLAAEYNIDLSARKEFIGEAIEMILAGQL